MVEYSRKIIDLEVLSMLKEFKEFALKGNVMDLAIGVIIGGAFQSIISSLVDDIIMPLINSLTGKMDFTDLVFKIGNSSVKYGSFISAVVNFLIVAFTLFLVMRYLNKLSKKLEEVKTKGVEEAEAGEPETKVCPHCLNEVPYHATRCGHCTSELTDKD